MTSVQNGQPAVDALVRLLDLKQLDPMRFEGISPPVGPQRVFGGQVAAQALVAAGRTVTAERSVNSLHGYFVRPGDPTEPIA
jgi:acyl-CoA thioesterase II